MSNKRNLKACRESMKRAVEARELARKAREAWETRRDAYFKMAYPPSLCRAQTEEV